MARVFGRVVGQGTYDAEHIALAIEWQCMDDAGGFMGGSNNAIPVPIGLADTELVAAARAGLAALVNEQLPNANLTSADVMGCQL